MKILLINKFYYVKGGSETYLFELKGILEKNGHEVIPFSMKDKRNRDSKYSNYFIDNIDYNDTSLIKKIKNAVKIIYNYDANQKLKRLIRHVKPDIAHLHIFQHQMSPSILRILKEEKIPIVYTMHDLKPVCLNYKMMNLDGLCEECRGGRYYNCLKNKCTKNSYLFSIINVIEGYVHKFLKSYNKIDKYITPSNFYREKMIESGFDENNIIHIPNFIEVSKYKPNYYWKDYFVYVGRLSEEKGIYTLIKAMKKVNKSTLKIIGTGPIENELKRFVKNEGINNIEFLGFKTGYELDELIFNSKFIVVPSEWYENAPMSIIEAMAFGKAVIGSNIGGIPELVKDCENGYLFTSGDCTSLDKAINNLLASEEKLLQFGKRSRMLVEKKYNDRYHYEKIIKVYENLLK